MDIFRLLSRGANIQKNGKHASDMALVNPSQAAKLATTSTKRNDRASKESQIEAVVERELDFFRNKTYAKAKVVEETAAKQGEEEEDEEEDEEYPPPLITNSEDARVYRKHHHCNVSGDDIPLPIGSFEDLLSRFQLHKHLLANLNKQDFTDPTPIQAEAIPIMLNGRDIIACAPTGSGKTLAFGIPLVQSLHEHKKNVGFRGLILSPTRELAAQIYDEIIKLSRGRDLQVCILNKSTATKFRNKVIAMHKFDILISTPLRLVDSIKDGSIELNNVQHLILDEADKLFEQGFLEQTDDILAACSNRNLQRAMFSATVPSGVETMANTIMHAPIRVIVGHKEGASLNIDQQIVYTGSEEGKLIAIRQMVQAGQIVPPTIIFLQSITRAKALFHELIYDGLNVDVIHGEKTGPQRNKVIERFKNGDIWVLICTDVLSRGIDFKGVNLVINYDVPQSAQAYVHRIGRTGRAGRKGRAVTFFTKEDKDSIKSVVNVMKQSGCNIAEWMSKMTKLSKNEKQAIKRRPADRSDISTVPHLIKNKRKLRNEMIEASKKRVRAEASGSNNVPIKEKTETE